MAGGTDRDNPDLGHSGQVWRRHIRRLGFRELPIVASVTLEGSSVSATATEIPLAIGSGQALAVGGVGVPVANYMRADDVSVSWLSADVPAGTWTLRLFKRSPGGDFSEAAQFDVETS